MILSYGIIQPPAINTHPPPYDYPSGDELIFVTFYYNDSPPPSCELLELDSPMSYLR